MISKTEEILEAALREARDTIKQQDDLLQQLMQGPSTSGFVVAIRSSRAVVSVAGAGLMELMIPTQPINGRRIDNLVQVGATLRIQVDPPAIIDVLDVSDLTGDLLVATKEGKAGSCEVDYGGTIRTIRYGSKIKVPEIGDRLMVDDDCHIALLNYGPDESKFSFQGVTGVSWDDIGGLYEAKEAMREAIELPFKYPELYKKYGKKNVKGVLLSGPPGCGKTMLAKATATSLSKIHSRKQTDTGFIYVKGPEMLDKYIGNTEALVRSLFARAKKHQKEHGYPAVIFIDEADALLGKRGDRPSMGIEATVVPQFLSEMDGLDGNTGAMVLLASNRPDSLDSAVTRDGRIDRKIRVTRPDQKGAKEIFRLNLKGKPLANNIKLDELAEQAAQLLYDNKYKMYDLFTTNGETKNFTLAGLVNGAMVAGVVDKATTISLRRDIQNDGKSIGLTLEDIIAATESVFQQNLHLNHEVEVEEFVEQNHFSVKQIIKAQTNLST